MPGREALIGLLCAGALAACAAQPAPGVSSIDAHTHGAAQIQAAPPQIQAASGPTVPGVLVMAHGGSTEWNASVEDAVAPLAEDIPTEIAFGMANPATLQEAVDRLERAGVGRIAVVRLFISGDSFLRRTRYLLGGGSGVPPCAPDRHQTPDGTRPIRTRSRIEIDPEGLADGFEAALILRSRALALSRDPSSEVVLLIGHGNGDDSVNDHLLRRMDVISDLIREEGFHEVAAKTLREDWAERRSEAEARIREWAADRAAAGLRVLVIPFRLSGFGPYADVLRGVDYAADGLGLIPHQAVTAWLRRRAQAVFCANDWRHEAVACPVASKED